MNLFELQNHRVTFSPVALTIQEFKALWDRDKSKLKDNAVEDLSYVYFTTDYMSPYIAYDVDIRGAKIQTDIITREGWKADDAIGAAQKKYAELQETPTMGLLRDAMEAMDQIRLYFREAEITKDKTGKAATALIGNISKLGDIIKGVKSLQELVARELDDSIMIRGSGNLGLREEPRRTR